MGATRPSIIDNHSKKVLAAYSHIWTILLLLLLFKTLQCTYVYLYHTYKPLQ